MTLPCVTRFAPSPNGELHLGHALSALTGFVFAKRRHGRFLLRIEDIDVQRSRGAFVEQIFDDLAWLGLRWEEPVLFQSQRFDVYKDAARVLERRGLLYPCWASRSELQEAAQKAGSALDPDGAPIYPGLYRDYPPSLAAERRQRGEPFALRINMQKALAELGSRAESRVTFSELGPDGLNTVDAAPEQWGDAVIVRKDVPGSYHLAVVVDDALQGVTHVTRGRDLYAATGIQRVLQDLLGLPVPVYHHHDLIPGPGGRKLSKSWGDTSLRSLRAAGITPQEVRRRLGFEDLDLISNS